MANARIASFGEEMDVTTRAVLIDIVEMRKGSWAVWPSHPIKPVSTMSRSEGKRRRNKFGVARYISYEERLEGERMLAKQVSTSAEYESAR